MIYCYSVLGCLGYVYIYEVLYLRQGDGQDESDSSKEYDSLYFPPASVQGSGTASPIPLPLVVPVTSLKSLRTPVMAPEPLALI